jgi:hypothetical protein
MCLSTGLNAASARRAPEDRRLAARRVTPRPVKEGFPHREASESQRQSLMRIELSGFIVVYDFRIAKIGLSTPNV